MVFLCVLIAPWVLPAQTGPQFSGIQALTNGEIRLGITGSAGTTYRLEASTNLAQWVPLITFPAVASQQLTDSAAPYLDSRFYRAVGLAGTNGMAGDHLLTADGEVILHPVNHASFLMQWNGRTIYNDPTGGSAPFQGFPRADLILVSHIHGDHYSSSTLDAVKGSNPVIIAPPAVYNALPGSLKNAAVVLANGARTNLLGIGIEAVPAYNFTSSNHPKGEGNGYVLTIGGKRIYISGDSEDTTEMRALEGIDVAFVCMNTPFTMTVSKAASAVRAFRPAVVFPYHYRNQGSSLADVNAFKRQVGLDLGIEVRLRKWY